MNNAGAVDGKVKAELSDEPDRAGVYTTSFAVNNLTDALLRHVRLNP